MGKKKYYKAFEKDLTCQGFQYEIGGTYEIKGPIIPCQRGFHFCDNLRDVYRYYPLSDDTRICEVEPLGDIVIKGTNGKYVTNKIYIKKEIRNPKKITNIGKNCTGFFNSGDLNSGSFNSGDFNSGDQNSGYNNSGNYNSGDFNSGSFNSGDFNSGDFNSGDSNVGYCNFGDYNVGNSNTGKYNFGDHNTGDYNIGDFNICSKSLGVFNVVTENYKIKMFDELSNWTLSDWYQSSAYNIMRGIPITHSSFIHERYMTEEEKQEHPEYKTLGGFTKVCIATNEDKQEWWNNLTDKQKEIIKDLPNFDPYKFEFCTGIKV